MTQQKAETKHTPGPWTVKHELLSESDESFLGHHSWPSVFLPFDNRLCLMELDSEIGYEEQAANARLIAAAPDLLAALQAFYKWWGSEECADLNPEPIPNALGEQMEAAIAKATNPKP